MTTEARLAEADRVELAYHWALAQVGVQTAEEAIALWQDVPPSKAAATATRWLSNAVRHVMLRRSMARDLAIGYYRLVRALRTGTTIADPRRSEPKVVRLSQLRREFELLMDDVAPLESPRTPAASQPAGSGGTDSSGVDETPADLSEDPPELDFEHDDDSISVEEIKELKALIEQLEAAAEDEARIDLEALGVSNLLKKLDEINDELTAAEVDTLREEAHRQAGARQAATAARITMNAARGLTYDLSQYDGRVMGWARFSTTGHPCGWCAMLIARGAIYKSRKSASVAKNDDGNRPGEPGDMNRFHDNDYCIAIPVFSEDQFDSSDIFALNREMDALWRKHIAGRYGGKEAIAQFRKLLRSMKAEAQAQAAA